MVNWNKIGQRDHEAAVAQRKAFEKKDALVVAESYEYLGVGYMTVDIDPADPYKSFKKLPNVIEFDGRFYGKSAFNSDRNVAYYRTDVLIARAAKEVR